MRFPKPLGNRYAQVPLALFEHAADLGLGPNEIVLVIALDTYRQRGRDVFPSQETLARDTPLSEHQVKRAVARLAQAGLIERSQPGAAGGGRGSNHYRLDPLWNKLATLASADAPQGSEVAVHQRSASGGVAEHQRTGCSAPVHPDIEVKKEESALFTDNDRKLCRQLADANARQNDEHRIDNDAHWLEQMHGLLEEDGRSPERVSQLISWVFDHDHKDARFWRLRLPSPTNLRKQFTVIWGQMQASQQPRPMTSDQFADRYEKRPTTIAEMAALRRVTA